MSWGEWAGLVGAVLGGVSLAWRIAELVEAIWLRRTRRARVMALLERGPQHPGGVKRD